MSWAEFYQICFVVGFLLSFVLFFGGLHWHLHWPFAGHVPHIGGTHASIGHPKIASSGTHISAINPFTASVFLTWFGGVGFLLTKYHPIWAWSSFVVATMVGASGAGFVFWFLARFLTSPDHIMDPADYEMPGVLGRVSMSIRVGGTGEIVFAQKGTRRVCGARSENGNAVGKDAEVVVTRYEKGIAYVRPWEELYGAGAPEGMAQSSRRP